MMLRLEEHDKSIKNGGQRQVANDGSLIGKSAWGTAYQGTSEAQANAWPMLWLRCLCIQWVLSGKALGTPGKETSRLIFFFFAAIIEFQVKELKSGEFFFLLLQGLKVVSKRPIKQEVKSPAQISIKPLPQILKN